MAGVQDWRSDMGFQTILGFISLCDRLDGIWQGRRSDMRSVGSLAFAHEDFSGERVLEISAVIRWLSSDYTFTVWIGVLKTDCRAAYLAHFLFCLNKAFQQ